MEVSVSLLCLYTDHMHCTKTAVVYCNVIVFYIWTTVQISMLEYRARWGYQKNLLVKVRNILSWLLDQVYIDMKLTRSKSYYKHYSRDLPNRYGNFFWERAWESNIYSRMHLGGYFASMYQRLANCIVKSKLYCNLILWVHKYVHMYYSLLTFSLLRCTLLMDFFKMSFQHVKYSETC